MSIRRVHVQYVGSTLRVPILDTLERDVDRVVLNPHSGPRTFLPEDESRRLGRENQQLRALLNEFTDVTDEYADCVRELTEKNIKLRNAAQDLYDIILENVCPHCRFHEWERCDGCRVYDNGKTWRELGIRGGNDGNGATEDNTATRD